MKEFIYFDKSKAEALNHIKLITELHTGVLPNLFKCEQVVFGTCTGGNILALLSLTYKLNGQEPVYIQIAVDYDKDYKLIDEDCHNLAVLFHGEIYNDKIRMLLGDLHEVKFN